MCFKEHCFLPNSFVFSINLIVLRFLPNVNVFPTRVLQEFSHGYSSQYFYVELIKVTYQVNFIIYVHSPKTITTHYHFFFSSPGIQKLVLTGRMGEAIQTTQNLYPELLEQNPNLLFMLKCRQFIEMVNGTDSEVRPAKSPRSQSNSPSMSPSYPYHSNSRLSPNRCHSPFITLKPSTPPENNNNNSVQSIDEMNAANRTTNGEVVNGNSPEISSTTTDLDLVNDDVEMENLDAVNENNAEGRTLPYASNGTVIMSSYQNGDDAESAHEKVGNEMGEDWFGYSYWCEGFSLM